jgi:hypothetical protein
MKRLILSRPARFDDPGPLAHLTGAGFLLKWPPSRFLLEVPQGTFLTPPISDPKENLILMFEQFKTVI